MAERVLVVEDDALVRDLVTLNLAHAGYEVSEAHDFPQGQAKLVEGKYELALVDAMLPGGDGFTLIRTAREKGIRQPLVMLTPRCADSTAAPMTTCPSRSTCRSCWRGCGRRSVGPRRAP
jgi:DNA-binding response OmpR family regulator